MPTPFLKSAASKSGKSLEDAEKVWEEVKADVFKRYPKLSSDSKFAIITKVVEKRLKIK